MYNGKSIEAGFQQAPIGMAVLHPDLHWIRINHEFCALVGYEHGELWALPCTAFISADETEKMNAFRQRMLEGEMQTAKLETRFIHKNGYPIDVEVRTSLVTNEDGQPLYFIDIVEDITAENQSRKQAFETAENYRLLIENAVDHAIMRLDTDGRILSWSKGAAAIFGYEEREILGRPTSVLFTPEDIADSQDKAELDNALGTGRSDDDRWHVRKDGTRFWSSGVVTPVKDQRGQDSGFVKILRDLTDRKIAQERSVYLAQHDNLTALPNRGRFNNELLWLIQDAKLRNAKVAVLFIDLDRFKNINDSLGHHLGDALLVSVADRLKGSIRKTGFVARLGGDEFGVICSNYGTQAELGHLASRLIAELSKPFYVQGHEITISASIGVSCYPKDSEDPNQILTYADLAMYHAKINARSSYQFYTENLDIEAKRRGSIEEDLRHAIERNELYLFYQPQFRLDTDRICGVEALLRWRNPRLAMLAPDEFISLADESGLIVPIGQWVMQHACRQARAWHESGHPDLRIAVNVSSRQLEERAFIDMVDKILEDSRLDPSLLELEITERLLMKDNLKNNSALQALKQRGIRISVDDFGTGFSSLSYLKHFPIDALKIDKLFIKSLPEDQHDAAIASAIVGMAHSLKMEVVAEGVETEGQRDFLKKLGCNCGQGYFYSPPASAQQISQLLDQSRCPA